MTAEPRSRKANEGGNLSPPGADDDGARIAAATEAIKSELAIFHHLVPGIAEAFLRHGIRSSAEAWLTLGPLLEGIVTGVVERHLQMGSSSISEDHAARIRGILIGAETLLFRLNLSQCFRRDASGQKPSRGA
jgi:hypothetical protein